MTRHEPSPAVRAAIAAAYRAAFPEADEARLGAIVERHEAGEAIEGDELREWEALADRWREGYLAAARALDAGARREGYGPVAGEGDGVT